MADYWSCLKTESSCWKNQFPWSVCVAGGGRKDWRVTGRWDSKDKGHFVIFTTSRLFFLKANEDLLIKPQSLTLFSLNVLLLGYILITAQYSFWTRFPRFSVSLGYFSEYAYIFCVLLTFLVAYRTQTLAFLVSYSCFITGIFFTILITEYL